LNPSAGQDIEGIENVRRKNFKKLIRELLKYNSNPKILEIGSGDGYFIDECNIANIDITGSEAYHKSFLRLKLNYGEKILKVHLPKPINTNLTFDIVVFNDVFEHLEMINDVIREVSLVLKDNGLIVLNLPTSDGIIFKISKFLLRFKINKFYDRLWQKNTSSPHLSYFNKSNLTKLFLKNRFSLLESGSLETLELNNFKRFRNLYKNLFLSFIFTILISMFFFLQFFLPKDIMYLIFKKNK
jgi:2-polyprenyl-3-methyl-5-hydroxy-6-metoxy-1,4-benzoquinol methylase